MAAAAMLRCAVNTLSCCEQSVYKVLMVEYIYNGTIRYLCASCVNEPDPAARARLVRPDPIWDPLHTCVMLTYETIKAVHMCNGFWVTHVCNADYTCVMRV